MAPTPFSDEEKEQVAALLKRGYTARQIGVAIGRTRASVLGMVHRNPQYKVAKLAPKPRAGGKKAAPRKLSFSLACDTPQESLRLNAETIGRNQCRYVYGDPKYGEWHFCGHSTKLGASYCEVHAARLYTEAYWKIKA